MSSSSCAEVTVFCSWEKTPKLHFPRLHPGVKTGTTGLMPMMTLRQTKYNIPFGPSPPIRSALITNFLIKAVGFNSNPKGVKKSQMIITLSSFQPCDPVIWPSVAPSCSKAKYNFFCCMPDRPTVVTIFLLFPIIPVHERSQCVFSTHYCFEAKFMAWH